MADDLFVTIVCTTYNHERYIRDCLDGFLAQITTFAFEVLVHDDASTDRTQEIIKNYSEQYPDKIIALLEKENLYSKGKDFLTDLVFPRARGKYIAFCEGDDYWTDKSKLQRQISFLEKHPDYIACVHNTWFHHCERQVKDFPMFIWRQDKDLTFEDILKWSGYGYQTSSLVVQKKYLKERPPFGYGEFPLAVFLVLSGKIRFLARNMSLYRFRSGQTATRANAFSRIKMEKEYESTITELQNMQRYVEPDKKPVIEAKITGYQAALKEISSMTDEAYLKKMRADERKAGIKFLIRSRFSNLYRFLKNIQMKNSRIG